MTKAFEEDIETPPTRNIPSPGQLDPDTRIPVINLEDGTRLVGDDAPKNKDLVEWLKLHPAYTVDMPSYVPVSMASLVRGVVLQGQSMSSPIQRRNLWTLCVCLNVSLSRTFPSFGHCIVYIREASFRSVLREGQPRRYLKTPIKHFLTFSISHHTDTVSPVFIFFAWHSFQVVSLLG